ncbi:MAG TPA: caspase family protein [Pirellulales bacterium]
MPSRAFITGSLIIAIGLGLIAGAYVTGAAEPDSKMARHEESENPRHALLVGCTKYFNHEGWQLEGPANDVQLLREVLTKHFGFESANITTLVDGIDDQHSPTKANIRREFENLAARAHDRDQIVVLLSGHGSQQPEQDSTAPSDHKLDGLDEIFLPADAGEWDEGQHSVTNVILDH